MGEIWAKDGPRGSRAGLGKGSELSTDLSNELQKVKAARAGVIEE